MLKIVIFILLLSTVKMVKKGYLKKLWKVSLREGCQLRVGTQMVEGVSCKLMGISRSVFDSHPTQ